MTKSSGKPRAQSANKRTTAKVSRHSDALYELRKRVKALEDKIAHAVMMPGDYSLGEDGDEKS